MLDVHIVSIHYTDIENEMPEVTSEETQDKPKSVVICGVWAQIQVQTIQIQVLPPQTNIVKRKSQLAS